MIEELHGATRRRRCLPMLGFWFLTTDHHIDGRGGGEVCVTKRAS